jgi:ribose transport system permease protein
MITGQVDLSVGSTAGVAGMIVAKLLELQVITAIVLGGARLAGGCGTMAGTVLGLFVIGVLNNGLILVNVPPSGRVWPRD